MFLMSLSLVKVGGKLVNIFSELKGDVVLRLFGKEIVEYSIFEVYLRGDVPAEKRMSSGSIEDFSLNASS